MTDQARSLSPSIKPLVIGLAIGLFVGGLAGAFIGGLLESEIPSVKSTPVRQGTVPPPRDERPAATGPTEAEPPAPEAVAPTQPSPK